MKKISSMDDLKSLAVFYCSKRETSEARLRLYLKRKLIEQKLNEEKTPNELMPDSSRWIDQVIQYCLEKKLVDDNRFSEMLTREYIRQKRGKFDITRKLKQKGLELPKDEETEINLSEPEELLRAIEFCKKLLLRPGNFKELEPFKLKQKLLQKLAARGYSLSIGKKAIEEALRQD